MNEVLSTIAWILDWYKAILGGIGLVVGIVTWIRIDLISPEKYDA